MSSASAQTPIPSRPDGYALGSGPATAPVVLDAFFDLLCPDSAASWPTVKKVIAAYPEQLYFLLHTFPLPYHTNSFIANQGLHVIDRAAQHNASALLQYTDLLFSIQQRFYNAATADKTITQVIAALASAVETAGLLSSAAFVKGIADSGINEEQRVSWKYGCSRAVTGTPSFLLNGVFINADASWELSDWQSVIDPLIRAERRLELRFAPHSASLLQATQAAAQLNSTCPPNTTECDYAPHEMECCKPGEGCIPNVGCRCLSNSC